MYPASRVSDQHSWLISENQTIINQDLSNKRLSLNRYFISVGNRKFGPQLCVSWIKGLLAYKTVTKPRERVLIRLPYAVDGRGSSRCNSHVSSMALRTSPNQNQYTFSKCSRIVFMTGESSPNRAKYVNFHSRLKTNMLKITQLRPGSDAELFMSRT